MTYATYELSIDQGEPILLYDFFIGTAHWRYTSADRIITYLANPYEPIAISSGAVNQGQEIKKKSLPITVPLDTEVVSVLQDFPPSGDFLVTITELHYTDPDQQGFICFVGRVMSQKQAGGTIVMSCEPAYTGVKTTGLRRRFQLNCAHVLYGVGCTILPSTYVTAAVISSVSGNGTVIGIPGLVPPTGLSFAGGYIEWDSGLGYLERRSINSMDSGGATLNLAYAAEDLAPGLAVSVYPGCDHTTGNCIAFNLAPQDPVNGNILNFGGQPYIPAVNPLTGNPIY
jgi:Phage conserved hypothetical protein BR0599